MLKKRNNFVLLVLFVLLVWAVKSAYCLDMEKMKVSFLKGDYKGAILEGEKLIAASSHSPDEDELYYILGLSYLKDGNYLRASDIFEIVIKEFKSSGYKDEAMMGLGDTFFLRQEYDMAEDCYLGVIRDNPSCELKAELYYRLSQVGFKKGDSPQGKKYMDILKQEYALNPQLKLNKDLYGALDSPSGFCYTVQVGSFANSSNARNLTQRLVRDGYPAYAEEVSGHETTYKVRVGKFKSLREAKDMERRLAAAGFPTKLCP